MSFPAASSTQESRNKTKNFTFLKWKNFQDFFPVFGCAQQQEMTANEKMDLDF